MMKTDSEKKLRFFGDGDSFGDGGAWVLIADTPEQLSASVLEWAKSVAAGEFPNDAHCEIKCRMMTDAEVDELPDM